MRLIDADKLRINCVCVNGICVDGRTIENAPTVKAIPIEWIKNKKVDFQNEDYPFNYCRGFQDGYNDCIDYLLSEWEEENQSLE